MAQYKACCPVIAPLTEASTGDTYEDGIILGKMIKTEIKPKTDEAKLYGDDGVAEDISETTGADVTLETSFLPIVAYSPMFGSTVTIDNTDAHNDEIDFGGDDNGSYVGYGFVICTIENGVKKYKTVWIPKVKFSLPSDSYATKGDKITFSTPSISGTAYRNSLGKWKKVKYYATAAAAIAAIKTLAGISTT